MKCTVCGVEFSPPLECDDFGIFKGNGFVTQDNLEWALKGMPAGQVVQAIELKGETWILHGVRGLTGGCSVTYTREELDKLLKGFSVRQHVLLRRTIPIDPPSPHVKPVIEKTGKVGLEEKETELCPDCGCNPCVGNCHSHIEFND